MPDTRFVFWDGVANVDFDAGTISDRLANRDYIPTRGEVRAEQRQNKKASRKAARSEPQRGLAVTLSTQPGPIDVRVVSVDEWFVPITDLLAIQLELTGLDDIRSLMIRIYRCHRKVGRRGRPDTTEQILVHQMTYDALRLQGMPTTDVSAREAPDFKRAREDHRRATGTEAVHCTSHCRVEAWVSDREKAFENVKAEATGRVAERFNNARAGQRVRYHPATPDDDESGVNQVLLGCPCVESIMAGRTALRIQDREPAHRRSTGARGDPSKVFADFRGKMRRVLYHICAHSRLGMELVRQVSDLTENRDKPVDIYPTTVLHGDIGGVGISADFPDDAAVEDRVAEVTAMVLDTVPAHPVANLNGPGNVRVRDFLLADAAMRPYLESKLAPPPAPVAAGPPLPGAAAVRAPNKNVLEFSVRRAVYREIGASLPGGGCGSAYYFNALFLERFDRDQYMVAYHHDDASCDVVCEGRPTTVAKATFRIRDDNPIRIETPLFIAFLHELMHARRFQLGLNAEYDVLKPGAATNLHPDSILAAVNRENFATAAAKKEFLSNLESRYSTKAREEFDTVEGAGVPVRLTTEDLRRYARDKLRVQRYALGQAADGTEVVHMTENIIREELRMNLRRRYVEGATSPSVLRRGAWVDETGAGRNLVSQPTPAVDPADLQPYRFINPGGFPAGRAPIVERVTFAEIRDQVDGLVSGACRVAGRDIVALQEGVNYFMYEPQRMVVAYRFGSFAKYRAADQSNDERVSIQSMYGELFAARADISGGLSVAARQQFEAALPPGLLGDDEAKRLSTLRVLQAMIDFDPMDRAVIFARSITLGSALGSDGALDAFASFKVRGIDIVDGLALSEVDGAQNKAMYVSEGMKYREDAERCHVLIHEPMHMFAIRREGFGIWDFAAGARGFADHVAQIANPSVALAPADPSPDTTRDLQSNIRSVVDEGTTEMLARIVASRLNRQKNARVVKVTPLAGLPYYEYPTHLVCRMVRDIDTLRGAGEGLAILGAAYFEATWGPLNDCFAEMAGDGRFGGRYTRAFWQRVGQLNIDNGKYFELDQVIAAVTALRTTFGVDWLDPGDLLGVAGQPGYKDPVCYEGSTSVGASPIADGMGCAIVADPPAPVPPPSEPVPFRCPECKSVVEIPGADILKAEA